MAQVLGVERAGIRMFRMAWAGFHEVSRGVEPTRAPGAPDRARSPNACRYAGVGYGATSSKLFGAIPNQLREDRVGGWAEVWSRVCIGV